MVHPSGDHGPDADRQRSGELPEQPFSINILRDLLPESKAPSEQQSEHVSVALRDVITRREDTISYHNQIREQIERAEHALSSPFEIRPPSESELPPLYQQIRDQCQKLEQCVERHEAAINAHDEACDLEHLASRFQRDPESLTAGERQALRTVSAQMTEKSTYPSSLEAFQASVLRHEITLVAAEAEMHAQQAKLHDLMAQHYQTESDRWKELAVSAQTQGDRQAAAEHFVQMAAAHHQMAVERLQAAEARQEGYNQRHISISDALETIEWQTIDAARSRIKIDPDRDPALFRMELELINPAAAQRLAAINAAREKLKSSSEQYDAIFELTKQRRVEVHQSEVVLYTAQRDLASRNGQTTDALRFEVLRARAHRETDTSRNEADHYQLDIATLNAIERYYQHIAGIYSAQSSQATDVLEQQKFAVHAAEARYQALRSASVSLRRREYIADIRKATLDQPDWSEALEIMTEKEGIVQEQHKSSQALREAGLQRLAARGNFYRVAAERAEAEGRVEDALRYQLWAAKHHRDAYTMDLHNIVDPLQMGLLPQGEAVFRDEVEEISQRIQAMIRDRTWSRDALSEPPPRQYGRFPNNNHFHRISTVEPFKWNGELDLDSRQIPGHLFM